MEDILRRYSQKFIFVQYPLINMKMKNLSILITVAAALAVTGCGKLENPIKDCRMTDNYMVLPQPVGII